MRVGARHSCNKQQQLTTTWPIAMDAIKAITDCDGCNQHHHHEALRPWRDKPLNCDEEGHGNQPQSHKAALPTNATRASWDYREYHINTHPATTIIVTGASFAAMQAQQMQDRDTQCRNFRQIGQIQDPDLLRWMWNQQQNIQKRICKQNKKTKSSWRICHASCTMIAR